MAEWVCEKCGGTGFVIVEKHGISSAERCSCAAAGRTRRNTERAAIPPLYRDASFDNFVLPADNPIQRDSLALVMTQVRAYTREFPLTQRPGLLLLGEPGTGKTHLAVAALRSLIEKGFEGLFFDYQNLLQRIRSSYDPASGTADREAYSAALDAEILLLDDLGAHRVTDWVEDTITSIITYRCNNKKAIIATTNLPDPDAGSVIVQRSQMVPGKTEYRITLQEKIGIRARSRLYEMCKVIKMPAIEDYRVRQQRAPI